MPAHLTFGIAGHAPNKPAHLDALFSDLLGLEAPDEQGYRPLPKRYSGLTGYFLAPLGTVPDGLLNTLDVLLSIEGWPVKWHLVTNKMTGQIEQLREYVDEVHETPDLTEFLIGVLHGSPGSQLLINWDQDCASDDALITAVQTAGDIPVRDLAQGLHTLLPGDDEAEAAAPEEDEGEEEQQGEEEGSATPPEQAPEDLPEEEQELEETPPAAPAAPASLEEEVSAAARQRTPQQPASPTGRVSVETLWLTELYRILDSAHRYADAEDLRNAAKNLDTLRTSPLADALAEQRTIVSKYLIPDNGSAEGPEETGESAPKNGTKSHGKSSGKKSRVMWDDDKKAWVKTGRGRVRDGVKTAWMDEAGNVTDTK